MGPAPSGMPFPSDGFTRVGAGTSGAFVCGGGAGVSSTAECLPLVQGGMERNSSKVRTRGLQHFQPSSYSQPRGNIFTQAMGSDVGARTPFCPSWKIGGSG